MGAWGVEAYENDTALDWAAGTGADLASIEAALDEVLGTGTDGYLGTDVGCIGVAACEALYDYHNPKPGTLAKILAVFGAKPEVPPKTPDLIAKACRSLDRVMAPNSELAELWSESEADGAAWRESIARLRQRLDGPPVRVDSPVEHTGKHTGETDHMDTLTVSGAQALSELTRLRAEFPSTGAYPFLVGGDDDLERIQEAAEFNEESPEAILADAARVDLAQWTQERRAEAAEDELDEDELAGVWPGENMTKGSTMLHADLLSGKPKAQANIGLVRLNNPWELPAHLKWGGWNECPCPEVHCAFHAMWAKEYGAQITGMSGDVIECLVAKPPRTQEQALRLAWQQYWDCTDIVDQGTESVAALAATLLNSPYWYFWWD